MTTFFSLIWRRLALTLGFFACLCAMPMAAASGWTQKTVANGIVYFATATPTIERYNIATSQWLPSISLSNPATAIYVDTKAIWIAYDRQLAKRALDGSNEQPLFNFAYSTTFLTGDGQYVFVGDSSGNGSGASATVDVYSESNAQFVTQWTISNGAAGGAVADPVARCLYVGAAPAAFCYKADGTLGVTAGTSGYNYGSGKSGPYLLRNNSLILGNGGSISYAPSMTQWTSLFNQYVYNQNIYDAVQYGSDITIVVNSNGLVAYDNQFNAAGQYAFGSYSYYGGAIALSGDQVVVFTADNTQANGIGTQTVPITQFSYAKSGAAFNAATLNIVPDAVVSVGDGTYLMLSKRYQRVLRWSVAQQAYIGSFLFQGQPSSLVYDAANGHVLLMYPSGAITQIRLADGASEQPFATVSTTGYYSSSTAYLTMLDNFVFAGFGGSAGGLYDARTGSLVSPVPSGLYSYSAVSWDQQNRSLVFGVNGNVQVYGVNTSGVFGAVQTLSAPYSYYQASSISISADGNNLLLGSGVEYNVNTLAQSGTLPNNVVSGVSTAAGNWATISQTNTNGTVGAQVQVWNSSLFQSQAYALPGNPLDIFSQPDGRLFVVTGTNLGVTQTLVDPVPGTTTSSPTIKTNPTGTTVTADTGITLSVVASGTSLSYQWYHNGSPINGATSAAYKLNSVQTADAGDYFVQVSNSAGYAVSAVATLIVTPADTTPNAISFQSVVGALPSSVVSSAGAYISGINVPVPVSIVGGRYSINGGSYTSAPGTIQAGQSVSVQVTSSSAAGGVATATLTVGSIQASFSVTTGNSVAPPTFAPTTSGSNSNLTLNVAISSNLLSNQYGSVFILATVDGVMLVNAGYGWQFWTGSGTLPGQQVYFEPTVDIQPFQSLDVSQLHGLTIYVGAGPDAATMLKNNWYSVVYQAP